MPAATLEAAIDTLVLKAARALEHTLDTSERETARVAAALGILRLAERAARRAEARESRGTRASRPARPRERARPAPTPAPKPADAPTTPTPPTPPTPQAHQPTAEPAPAPPAPHADALTPDEVAELARRYSVADAARLHDPELSAYWRGKLRMARRWSRPPSPRPDG